jgi:ribosomal protein L37E
MQRYDVVTDQKDARPDPLDSFPTIDADSIPTLGINVDCRECGRRFQAAYYNPGMLCHYCLVELTHRLRQPMWHRKQRRARRRAT